MALSAVEIYGLALDELSSREASITATAIALAESGGNPGATNTNTNGSMDAGLWQINSVHKRDHPTWTVAWLQNPKNNAKAMATVSRNGSTWSPWTVYKTGAYKQYLNQVEVIAFSEKGDSGILEDIPIIGGALDSASDATQSIASAISSATNWITNSENWLRVVQVVGGIALALIGAAIVANSKVSTR